MNKFALRNWLGNQWSEWRNTLLFFVALVMVKSSFADWNWVPTGSMNPTIVEGDMVYINKLAYDLRIPLTLKRINEWGHPKKGDIAVLLSPEDEKRLVKRVIGIPGDRVEMRDQILLINGEPLEYGPLPENKSADVEKQLRENSIFATEVLGNQPHAVMSTPALRGSSSSFGAFVVPEGKYFVMGDNRDNSRDSRAIGLVDRELFLGRAERVLVSFDILDWYQPRLSRFFTKLN
ncbi:signal peptidase I [Puniceicoccaceae bacterium K14]|nr:signal peptidase I [Puniceicoccaceae bacterium K14]